MTPGSANQFGVNIYIYNTKYFWRKIKMKNSCKRFIPLLLSILMILSTIVVGSAVEVPSTAGNVVLTDAEFSALLKGDTTENQAYFSIINYSQPDKDGNATVTVRAQAKDSTYSGLDAIYALNLALVTNTGVAASNLQYAYYACDPTTGNITSTTTNYASPVQTFPPTTRDITDASHYSMKNYPYSFTGTLSLIQFGGQFAYNTTDETLMNKVPYGCIVFTFKLSGCPTDGSFVLQIGVPPISKDLLDSYAFMSNSTSLTGLKLSGASWADVADLANNIKYVLSDEDKDHVTLSFDTATVPAGDAIGADNVPTATTKDPANNWVIKDFTVDGVNKTPAELAAYKPAGDENIGVNVILDNDHSGEDDRLEVYINYSLRTGDEGTLAFAQVKLTKAKIGDTVKVTDSNIPGVTLPEYWKLDGYYFAETKYTAATLKNIAFDENQNAVEVRTYPDKNDDGKDDRDQSFAVDIVDANNKPIKTVDIPYGGTVTVTDKDGGLLSGVNPNPLTVTEDGTVKLPVPPTVPNKEFSGWEVEQDDKGNATVKPSYKDPGDLLKDTYKNGVILKLDYLNAFIKNSLTEMDGGMYDSVENKLCIPKANKFNLTTLLKDGAPAMQWTYVEYRDQVKERIEKPVTVGADNVITLTTGCLYHVTGTSALGQTVSIYVMAPGDTYADQYITSLDVNPIVSYVNDTGNFSTKYDKNMADVNNDGYITSLDCNGIIAYVNN